MSQLTVSAHSIALPPDTFLFFRARDTFFICTFAWDREHECRWAMYGSTSLTLFI